MLLSKAIGPLHKSLMLSACVRNRRKLNFVNPANQKSLTLKNIFSFCKSQTYVDHYNTLKNEIKEKQQKLKELEEKVQMLRQMSEMSSTDKILQLLYQLFGANYETKAFKQHKVILIDLRNILEKRIEESSVKWEEPRKLILGERESKIFEFIEAIIEYEGKMTQFIKQRENNKAEHLADINEGLVLTHKLLIKNIEKQGGVHIRPEKNQLFNENQHEVVNSPAQKQKTAKVASLVSPGWKLKDRVIRKAKVSLN